MAPGLYVQHGLSDRDINTVLRLYSDDSSAEEQLPEKDEYGRPLSPAVKSEFLARLGSKYAMSGNFEKALVYLKESLKLDPSNSLAKSNISVAANNLAISDGVTAEKALQLLRLALYWNSSSKAAQTNLSSRLQESGIDPNSAAQRVSVSDKLLASGDKIGAIVELREALRIKDDPIIRKKLTGIIP